MPWYYKPCQLSSADDDIDPRGEPTTVMYQCEFQLHSNNLALYSHIALITHQTTLLLVQTEIIT